MIVIMQELGLYVHIPFCKQKCYYCDFCSYPDKLSLQNQYINSIMKEIESIENKENYMIKTIYIGGGTPSIINPYLIEKLLNKIKGEFCVLDESEITIEVNPGTITEEKLNIYKKSGINRLSIGLQSTNDNLLKEIGRIHNYKDFENTFELARMTGFSNINVDLMIGLPNQCLDDVIKSLENLIDKSPEHISVYSLIVEEGTPIDKLINLGKLNLPDEDLERSMYKSVKEILEQNGYNQYEISNFAKKSYESKHNMDCWNQNEYIGLGAAAHSYLNSTRYSNTNNIEEYIKNIEMDNYQKNITIHENQTKEDMMREYMIIGLRKIEGISIKKFKQKFNENPLNVFKQEINKMQDLKLLQKTEETIKLTLKGIDFANIVWEEFI